MHKPLLIGLLLIAFVAQSKIPGLPNVISVECPMVGPFEKFQNDSEISYIYKMDSTSTKIVEELKVYDAKNGKVFYTVTMPGHIVYEFQKNTVTFPLKTKNYFYENGFKIVFNIKVDDLSIFECSGEIFPIEKKTIYVNKDDVTLLKTKNVMYGFQSKKEIYKNDDLNFYNPKAIIDSDLHYALDLSPFSFICNSDSFEYKSAQLLINDGGFLLKNFTHLNGKAVFDLEIYKIGKNLYFKHKNHLFVNRSNLESSSYYIPGYVESENLFFPVNSKEKFLGSNIELVVNDFGYNKFNLVFDLKYDKAQNLIGNCINSDYCVVEGVE